MRPRRQQASITFQSDRAKARLALLTRTGRSQAEIIEDALDQMTLPGGEIGEEAWLTRLQALIDKVPKDGAWTITQFDAAEYDEHGDPR